MKLYKHFLVIATIVLLTSCTFTENIYINEDGTGKFSVDMDASGLMAMMPADSLGTTKPMDSTFTFKQLFQEKKDSIAKLPIEQQQRLKKLEGFSMRTKMIPAEKQFMFSVFTDFKNVSDLQDAMTTINDAQGAAKDKSIDNPLLPSSGFGNNNSILKYSYDGKKFTRKATLLKKEVATTENDSAEAAYKMIYESSTYTVNYHFPKKVKKVSNKKALYSEDRKTITIEFPFNEYMKEPEKLNFEVEFE
jgi:hypothetical protein